MLILEANICFDRPDVNPEALNNDLTVEGIIRPAINFGNDLLFSGTILVDRKIQIIRRGEFYNAIIEMPTIEDEAYEAINHLLNFGNIFKMQSASKVIGKGKIIDFIYEKQ